LWTCDDTIAALASAQGGGLRAILRMSGPGTADCLACALRLAAGASIAAVQSPTCLRARITLSAELGEVPLRLYYWPTERSYTRQPSAELHLPGSPPVAEAALAAVCRAGARLAQPGEFTLRAFLAGRLDLIQAEAVLGVIDAADRSQLDAALGQLAGGLGRPLTALREQLLDLLAQLEAGLDFADEDIEFISPDELAHRLQAAVSAIAEQESRMETRGQAGRLPRVVLAGLPNAGKSSLLNAIAKDQLAIVSEVAGTTRDFVACRLELNGRECLLIDTAGMQSVKSGDGIDAAAQRLMREQTRQADLTLLCLDVSRPAGAQQREQLIDEGSAEQLIVWTKCDLPSAARHASDWPDAVLTSSRTGLGVEALRLEIARRLALRLGETDVIAGTADRSRDSLRLAREALQRAKLVVPQTGNEELTAMEVRVALDELGRVVGAVYTDDVLDRVFSRFCIGK
jgi:tRNA modification GTPase